jgi:hypothetical protein
MTTNGVSLATSVSKSSAAIAMRSARAPRHP